MEYPVILPPEMSLETVTPTARFVVMGQGANLWFERGSDVLIVSFDNLATIDEGWPRGPWMHRRLLPLGYSVLGVQSHAKDWFRTPTAPNMLRQLTAQGFFDGFARIVMIGASMGGFAALNFAPLVPRARVIALSAQSTMNKDIAPYEARFPFAVRKSNWQDPDFLDAARAISAIPAVALLFDPLTPEDAKHADRMAGANVQRIPLPHATHEAVRVVIKSGALATLIADMVAGDRVTSRFWSAYRGRKYVPKWQKSLLMAALERNHPRLALRGAEQVLRMGQAAGLADEDLAFARRVRRNSTL
jgi:pimeloyl-ACP methyl ester carboxylesterase